MREEHAALLESFLDDSITLERGEELLALLKNDPEFKSDFAAALRAQGLLREAASSDRDAAELARVVGIAVGSGRDSRRFESRVMQAIERPGTRSIPRRRRAAGDSPWLSPGRLIFMAAGVLIAVFGALTLFNPRPEVPPLKVPTKVAVEAPVPVPGRIERPVPARPAYPKAAARKPGPSPRSKSVTRVAPATPSRPDGKTIEAEMRRTIQAKRKNFLRKKKPAEKPEPAPVRKPSGATEASLVVLEEAVGGVEILKKNAPRPAVRGQGIAPGEGLRTVGVTSRAVVRYPDGTRVVLEGSTAIGEWKQDGGKRISLDQGTLTAQIARQPAREPMVFRTPHGEATVLGTTLKLTVVPGLGGSTRLEVTEGRVRLTRSADRKSVEVPAGHHALLAPGTTLAALPNRPRVNALWIRASRPDALFKAPMTKGPLYAAGSLTGLPVFSAEATRPLNRQPGKNNQWNYVADGDEGGWVTYVVDLPADGTWYLWARQYYPGSNVLKRPSPQVGYPENDPNSFYVRVDDGREKILGNLMYDTAMKKSAYRRWHWHGNGDVEVGKPAPINLGVLRKGRHTLRIRDRDAVERTNLRLAPRLDVLCLTRDADYVPSDDDAKQGLR